MQSFHTVVLKAANKHLFRSSCYALRGKRDESRTEEKADFFFLHRAAGSKICQPKNLPLSSQRIGSLVAPTFLFVHLCQRRLWTHKQAPDEAEPIRWTLIRSTTATGISVRIKAVSRSIMFVFPALVFISLTDPSQESSIFHTAG